MKILGNFVPFEFGYQFNQTKINLETHQITFETVCYWKSCNVWNSFYWGSPTYMKTTNTVSTTTVFGLCTCKWGFQHQQGTTVQSH